MKIIHDYDEYDEVWFIKYPQLFLINNFLLKYGKITLNYTKN